MPWLRTMVRHPSKGDATGNLEEDPEHFQVISFGRAQPRLPTSNGVPAPALDPSTSPAAVSTAPGGRATALPVTIGCTRRDGACVVRGTRVCVE
jgi:hypothetical protein